jgi:hypothetical protein
VRYASASFRDPDARVLEGGGRGVLRVLSERAAAVDQRLREKGLITELVRDGLLIENTRRDDLPPPPGWAAVVESRALPFVSYPYEWSFTMLKDAALLTLDLTARALERGASLKDASAYNVLFEGARPVFIDIASLASYEEGTPWLAYGQFCDQFLAPLMLEAYKRVPFQPLLRSSLAGLSITSQLAPLMSARDVLRPGVLTHVKLRALLDRRTRTLDTASRRTLRGLAVPKSAVLRNIRGLRRIVAGLHSRAPSTWADYTGGASYGADLAERKARFVAAAGERTGRGALAWDVGANTGRHARLLAGGFDCVVAMDGDAGAVDRLYRSVKGSPEERAVLPLVIDVMNPSPAQGWRGRERQSLLGRGRPDLALYLALIHHLCIGQGLPLAAFLDMVRETSRRAVVEFVTLEDPMSQAVLATKVEAPDGYAIPGFRALALERGAILAEEALSSTRTLFLLAFDA